LTAPPTESYRGSVTGVTFDTTTGLKIVGVAMAGPAGLSVTLHGIIGPAAPGASRHPVHDILPVGMGCEAWLPLLNRHTSGKSPALCMRRPGFATGKTLFDGRSRPAGL